MWSHHWSLRDATGQVYTTGTPAANGGFVKIDDYTIQAVHDCDTPAINEIGVFTHELGHGFGLPDLYDTDQNVAGIGRWGLMAQGAWGCGSYDPARPCGMSAWSKAALGWVDVRTLPPGADLGRVILDPVEGGHAVVRVDAGDGSGEYYLLENRQPMGADGEIPGPGLLVWHVDPAWVEQHLDQNAVNADPRHQGVWLRQADGRDDLTAGRNGGDAGDPFPGSSGATAFDAGTSPASTSHAGTPTGLTLLDVTLSGQQVAFHALTRFQTLTLRGEGTSTTFSVDGAPLDPGEQTLTLAPFERRDVAAPGGLETEPGVRRAFSGWSDDPAAPRTRTFTMGIQDTVLAASFDGGLEYHLDLTLVGDTAGVAPGEVRVTPSSSDGWYAPNADLSLLASPRAGFAFQGWSGDLAGSPNPVLVTLAVPLVAAAVFRQTFAAAPDPVVSFPAAAAQDVALQASDGTAPYTWSLLAGTLPPGMALTADGRITGPALRSGRFPLTVEVRDAIGLLATADVTLDVGTPELGVTALTDGFFLRPGALTADQKSYLDNMGNHNGAYDLGDFRAFILANPELPMTAVQRGLVRRLVPLVRFGAGEGP